MFLDLKKFRLFVMERKRDVAIRIKHPKKYPKEIFVKKKGRENYRNFSTINTAYLPRLINTRFSTPPFLFLFLSVSLKYSIT